MVRIIVPALALALCGCAAQVISSTPRSVIVAGGAPPNAANAQALADAQCKQHGRYARMSARPVPYVSKDFVFECVE
jgi:hypothetical protein